MNRFFVGNFCISFQENRSRIQHDRYYKISEIITLINSHFTASREARTANDATMKRKVAENDHAEYTDPHGI